MKRSYHFRNSTDEPMLLMVELSADEIEIPAGSTLTLHCEDKEVVHPPTFELHEHGISFYPECETFTAEIDGEAYPV